MIICWISSHIGIPRNEKVDKAAEIAPSLSIKNYSCRLSDSKKREMSKNLSSALGAPVVHVPTTSITEHEVPILSANEIVEIFGENMFFEPIDDESHKD